MDKEVATDAQQSGNLSEQCLQFISIYGIYDNICVCSVGAG
jgi:hypothetical protein